MRLTKSELEVMSVMWKAGKPLSRNEILELSVDKTWKDSSVHIILNGMLRKEAIREDGFTRCGKVWGRLYAPNITMEEYYAENVFSKSDISALPLMFSAMIQSDEITPEMIDELEKMLEERKEELSRK